MSRANPGANQARHVFRFTGRQIDDQLWLLDEEEAWHASKVLRLDEGATVEVTDGSGNLATGTLIRHEKRHGRLDGRLEGKQEGKRDGKLLGVSVTRQVFSAPARARFELVLGALKPGDIDEIIPGLVELGAKKISVYVSQQTGKDRITDRALDRWQRIAVTAMKQSKQVWRTEIATWVSFSDWLNHHRSTTDNASIRWIFTEPEIAESGATTPRSALAAISHLQTVSAGNPDAPWLTGVVGSEKGFTADEFKAALTAGFAPVSLGPNVLRSKTAAHAAATILAMAASEYR